MLLVRNLLQCGCTKSAYDFSIQARSNCPNHDEIEKLSVETEELYKKNVEPLKLDRSPNIVDDEYYESTAVRRELYAWNTHEPNRFSDESLEELNDQLSNVAPKLEIRATELPALGGDPTAGPLVKQLGLFAKERLQPRDMILNEKSLLTASAIMRGSFCDACGVDIAKFDTNEAVSCPDCVDIVFCSEDCLHQAQESYHPALCDNDVENVATDAPRAEATDALYSLLLLRTFAMAETQEIHPLDLKEVKFIWGDYNFKRLDIQGLENIPKTLPWSFKYSVLTPLHMLEKMNINIFEASTKYDFWVFNTLYAKYRGTASGRIADDGKTEVSAVHPLWCLANHSCDPIVKWDWQGSIKFWVRDERVRWDGKEVARSPGIDKDEEIFSHYCDIDLAVKDRRAWAKGALGGDCQCERCIWEASL